MSAYRNAIGKLVSRRDLARDEAEAVMTELMEGQLEPAQIGAFLAALAIKGETAEELTGFAAVMRRKCLRVNGGEGLLDTCGTGGSGLSTPNTSTISAFVLAAGGVRVAKHGNRSSTGRCGSADVLERLGVPIDLGPEEVERLLAGEGIAFMLAPRFHPAVAHAGPVRKAIGVRTTFNFLGPLANPAFVSHQVLGVSDLRRAPLMAAALAELGTTRALVVSGEDGLDEITLTGPTRAWHVEGGKVTPLVLTPDHAGLGAVEADHLRGGEPDVNMALFLDVLEGREKGPIRDLVALNAGAGFWIAGVVPDLASGHARALEVLAGKAAADKLASYRRAVAKMRRP